MQLIDISIFRIERSQCPQSDGTKNQKYFKRYRGPQGRQEKRPDPFFTLFVALPGRVNFLAMARHGRFSEKTYRNHFEKKFDFFDFNKQLVKQFRSPHRIIAGDCSFIPEAGKSTPHLGEFRSGCASKAVPGLEISSPAVIDVDTNRAFHLECGQTPGTLPDNESRIDFYVDQVAGHAEDLKELADYFVYDGAAAKKKFADGIVEHTGLHLVSKLRRNANLRYLYTGP
ncbi:MAG: hypothetical protein D3906_12550, partial [Candidatus Electrothrix sp. AUS1_2]|nr:hypothetical protein [Candidatus Electrothrix sp. AUS1_2]